MVVVAEVQDLLFHLPSERDNLVDPVVVVEQIVVYLVVLPRNLDIHLYHLLQNFSEILVVLLSVVDHMVQLVVVALLVVLGDKVVEEI